MSADERPPAQQGEFYGYESMVSTLADPVSFVSRDYVYLTVNDAYERYAGQSKDQIIGRTVLELRGDRAFRELIQPNLDRCFEGHQVHYQIWIDSPTLGRRFMDIHHVPVTDDSGAVIGAAVHTRDLTERKRIEDELETSRQFFQSALDALSANIAVLDAAGTIVAVNASWRTFGTENGLLWADQGVGHNYLAVLDAAAQAGDDSARQAARGIGEVIARQREAFRQEYPCHSPGEDRWFAMSVTRFESAQGLRVVTSHENITQRKLAELALREAKEAAETARSEAETAHREEERRRQIAESLRDVVSVLNSTHSLRESLEYVAVQASRLLRTSTVAIYRTVDGARTLDLQAAHTHSAECVSPSAMRFAGEILRRAIASRQAVTIPDMRADKSWTSQHKENGALPAKEQAGIGRSHAVLVVPIVVQDSLYGGMLLCYDAPHAFSEEDATLATAFGDQIALAIETARLRDQAQETAVAAERNRLARDLHDAVTQTLFSANVVAETLPRIWDTHPNEAQRGLEELRTLTRGALAEMRTLLLELRPAALTEKPLDDLLRSLAQATTSRTRVPVTLDAEGDISLPPQQQVAFYRIAQEALNNTVKHAEASAIAMHLGLSGEHVVLSIADNGSGFDPAVVRTGHLGMGIMRERAEQIGATFAVESAPSAGTRITLRWRQTEEVTGGR